MKGQVLTTQKWSEARKLLIHECMPRELRPVRNLAVGRRLMLARIAMGWANAQGKYAQLAEISPTAYNQWETGENYPGLENAIKLCEKHKGLTLDYIYRGIHDGLSARLSNTIESLASVHPDPSQVQKPAKAPLQPPQPIPDAAAKVVKVSPRSHSSRRRKAS